MRGYLIADALTTNLSCLPYSQPASSSTSVRNSAKIGLWSLTCARSSYNNITIVRVGASVVSQHESER